MTIREMPIVCRACGQLDLAILDDIVFKKKKILTNQVVIAKKLIKYEL